MTAPDTRALNDVEMADAAELERARQGLWKARRVHVPPGQFLYRFTSRATPRLWFSGAWWFEYEHYRAIVDYAERAELTLGYAARRLAGLAYEWPDCAVDGVERALVVARLDAWAGPGRVIAGTLRAPGTKTRRYTLAPPQDLRQLYIPGLRDGHGATATRSAISLRALDHCTCEEIPSGYFA